MQKKDPFPIKPLPDYLKEEFLFTGEEAGRITIREDQETVTILIDGLYAGFVRKGPPFFNTDTLVVGANYDCESLCEAVQRTFEDFETLGTIQRIRASILKDGTPVDLHELLMAWLYEGLSRDERFMPLIEADYENPFDLLNDLMREWGKIYYSSRGI